MLADLGSRISDLQRAASACERLIAMTASRLDDETAQALYEFAIFTYARCFASGVRARLRVDLCAHMDEGARAFHRQVLDIRDKLLAHAVSPLETVIPISVLADPDTEPKGVATVGYLHFRRAWVLDREAPKLLALARGLLTVLEAEAEGIKEGILAELRQGDIEAMYAEPQVSFTGEKSRDFARRRRPAPGSHPSGKPWPLA